MSEVSCNLLLTASPSTTAIEGLGSCDNVESFGGTLIPKLSGATVRKHGGGCATVRYSLLASPAEPCNESLDTSPPATGRASGAETLGCQMHSETAPYGQLRAITLPLPERHFQLKSDFERRESDFELPAPLPIPKHELKVSDMVLEFANEAQVACESRALRLPQEWVCEAAMYSRKREEVPRPCRGLPEVDLERSQQKKYLFRRENTASWPTLVLPAAAAASLAMERGRAEARDLKSRSRSPRDNSSCNRESATEADVVGPDDDLDEEFSLVMVADVVVGSTVFCHEDSADSYGGPATTWNQHEPSDFDTRSSACAETPPVALGESRTRDLPNVRRPTVLQVSSACTLPANDFDGMDSVGCPSDCATSSLELTLVTQDRPDIAWDGVSNRLVGVKPANFFSGCEDTQGLSINCAKLSPPTPKCDGDEEFQTLELPRCAMAAPHCDSQPHTVMQPWDTEVLEKPARADTTCESFHNMFSFSESCEEAPDGFVARLSLLMDRWRGDHRACRGCFGKDVEKADYLDPHDLSSRTTSYESEVEVADHECDDSITSL